MRRGTCPRRRLRRRASRIGGDHIASTVNTLVFAYVGASLSLFLFFSEAGQPIGRTLLREVVASEIVRTLVGSIGLVLAVPVTTLLAAYVLHADLPPRIGVVPAGAAADHPPPTWDDFAPHDR